MLRSLAFSSLLLAVGAFGQPEISAKSAIVIEYETGAVLFEKNAHEQLAPASTTKILTALLLCEETSVKDWIRAPSDVEKIEGSSLHLRPGEVISSSDMLRALLMRSANDGAHAVAHHISGGVREFARLMNERAAEIGCEETAFTNPHGLPDPDHRTTAFDLALIGREAMANEQFRRVAGMQKSIITRSLNKEDLLMTSHNVMLERDPDFEGIKTGYTNNAGFCFVGSRKTDGWRIITVVLNGDDWARDTQKLADWAYLEYEPKRIASAGDQVTTATVKDGVEENLAVSIIDDVDAIVHVDGSGQQPSYDIDPLRAPVRSGDPVGTMTTYAPDGTPTTYPLVAAADLAKAPIWWPKRGYLYPTLAVALILAGAVLMIRSGRIRNG